jgi:hypothetical protein
MAITFVPSEPQPQDVLVENAELRAKLSQAWEEAAWWKRKFEHLAEVVMAVGEGLVNLRDDVAGAVTIGGNAAAPSIDERCPGLNEKGNEEQSAIHTSSPR